MTWQSVLIVGEIIFKSLLIGASIAVLMIVFVFSYAEIFLVSTTAILAAMIMAISEYNAIAAERSRRK